ncbi:MAG: universal stress protein [Acidimicrobiales bacterium]|nr:universal stress protein [Acidimicrobiales bacterium]
MVVGVDGSEGSLAALRWAHQEAKLRGDELDVVMVWTYPYRGRRTGMSEPSDDMELEAAQALEAAMDRFRAELGDDHSVAVHGRLVEGGPAAALLEAADGADLLVVGSRGHGGFASLLLGSVSHQVAHHAVCPVAIIRG